MLQMNAGAFACKLDLASPPAGSESRSQNGLLIPYVKTVQQRHKNGGGNPAGSGHEIMRTLILDGFPFRSCAAV